MAKTETQPAENATLANPMPPLSPDEYAALKASIARDGLQYAIKKSAGPAMFGEIVDGFNRERACKELGIEPRYESERFATEAAFRLRQLDLNLHRRQLTATQKVMLGMMREPWEVRRIEEIRRDVKLGKAPAAALEALAHTDGKIRTSAVVANAVGLKRDTYEHGKFVLTNASPSIKEQLLAGALTIDRAYAETRREKGMGATAVLGATIAKRVGALPRGKWSCVVAVPPWRTGDGKSAQKGRLAAAEIAGLGVRELLGPDSLVALVAPIANLADAYRVIDAWGAQAFGLVVWIQGSKASDVAVLAKTGRFEPKTSATGLVLRTEPGHVGREFYDLVDGLVPPDLEGLVLFADPRRAGWRGWDPAIK